MGTGIKKVNQLWENFNWPSTWATGLWEEKSDRHIFKIMTTMEYYSAIKQNEFESAVY